jgi:hypothetical protein
VTACPVAVALSTACTGAASVPYVIATYRGTARPRPVSWAIWAALLAIGSAAELAGHQVTAAVYGLGCCLVCLVIAALALRIPASQREDRVTLRLPGDRQVTLDRLCFAGAAAGLFLLIGVGQPLLSLAVTIAADFTAYIPTYINGWRYPRSEPWIPYALYALGALLALLAAHAPSATALAYPGYLAASDTAMTFMLLARLRRRPDSG